MPQLAPDTNKILERLVHKIDNEVPVTGFELRRYLSDAEKQISDERVYAVKSLAYTAARQRENAKESALLALEVGEELPTITNCLNLLHVNGFHQDILKYLEDNADRLDYDEFWDAMVSVLVALPNINYLERVTQLFQNLKNSEIAKQGKAMELCKAILSNALVAEREFDIPSRTIDKVSGFAAAVSDMFQDVVMNRSSFNLSPSGDWFSLTYYVELEETKIISLNMALADLMIESNLDRLPLVARFELLPDGIESVRSKYAD